MENIAHRDVGMTLGKRKNVVRCPLLFYFFEKNHHNWKEALEQSSSRWTSWPRIKCCGTEPPRAALRGHPWKRRGQLPSAICWLESTGCKQNLYVVLIIWQKSCLFSGITFVKAKGADFGTMKALLQMLRHDRPVWWPLGGNDGSSWSNWLKVKGGIKLTPQSLWPVPGRRSVWYGCH